MTRFTDEFEIEEIRGNAELNRSLKRGIKDAKAGRGRMRGTAPSRVIGSSGEQAQFRRTPGRFLRKRKPGPKGPRKHK